MSTYKQFLESEATLAQASKNPNSLTKRFFELHGLPEAERGPIDRVEYETLTKVMRARWRALEADKKAKKLVARIEADHRKVDIHAKILLGIAAIELAQHDSDLQKRLLILAGGMPSANKEYLTFLLGRSVQKQ